MCCIKKFGLLLAALAICYLAINIAAAKADSITADWLYKKPINISNSGSALTDYQVLVTNPIYNEAGLVGSWHFSEGSGNVAADSSGNGNVGTLTGTTWVIGKFGNGLSFTAANHKFSTGSTSILNTDTHTIAFWLKFTQAPPNEWRQILAYRPSGTDRSPSIWSYPNAACIHWRYDPGNTGVSCGGPTGESSYFTVGTWYYIVGVKSGSSFTMYVNGTSVGTWNVANPKTAGAAALELGQTGYNSAIFDIDEVRIYNRALIPSEISALYNAKARLDYADIRFVDSDDTTQLNHWMESDGRFWIKVPSIPAGSKAVYMYYGNSTAISASNAKNTFNFFDDFSTVDAGWTNANIAGGVMTVGGGVNNGANHAVTGIQTGQVYIEYDYSFGPGNGATQAAADYFGGNYLRPHRLFSSLYTNGDSGNPQIGGVNWNTGVVHKVKMWWWGTGANQFKVGIDSTTATGTLAAGTVSYIQFNIDNIAWGPSTIDNIIVRKYSLPEPTTTVLTEYSIKLYVNTQPSDTGSQLAKTCNCGANATCSCPVTCYHTALCSCAPGVTNYGKAETWDETTLLSNSSWIKLYTAVSTNPCYPYLNYSVTGTVGGSYQYDCSVDDYNVTSAAAQWSLTPNNISKICFYTNGTSPINYYLRTTPAGQDVSSGTVAPTSVGWACKNISLPWNYNTLVLGRTSGSVGYSYVDSGTGNSVFNGVAETLYDRWHAVCMNTTAPTTTTTVGVCIPNFYYNLKGGMWNKVPIITQDFDICGSNCPDGCNGLAIAYWDGSRWKAVLEPNEMVKNIEYWIYTPYDCSIDIFKH